MTCRLFSLNCRGLANKDKRNELMHWLANHVKGPFDFIMLQETHSCQSDEKIWKSQTNTHLSVYKSIFSHGTRASKGVALLIKK